MGADTGLVVVNVEECKGCGLCVEACPPKVLEMAAELSHYGVHPAHYIGSACTGCGICFYACPEPGALTVYRARRSKPESKVALRRFEEEIHAPVV